MFEAVFREAGLPEGLLQVVVGGADVGEAIVTDPNVTRVSFTGSTAAGGASARWPAACSRRSASSSAATTRSSSSTTPTSRRPPRPAPSPRSSSRARSASRPAATSSTAASPPTTSTCSTEKARRLRLGDPYREDVELGPIVNEKQLERVDGIVQRSVEGGARVVVGGTHEGLFYRPTVLTDVTTDQAGVDRRDLRPGRAGRRVRHRRGGARARQRQRVRARPARSTRARSRAAWRSPTGSAPAWSTSTTRRSTTRRRSRSAAWARPATAPLRRRGEPRRVHRVAVGDGARRAAVVPVPVLIADDDGIDHRGRPARRRVDGDRVARRLRGRLPGQRRDPRARCSRPPATLDYVPNALARGLLKSRVPVVGVIVHDITDPYFAEVVRGVEDAASAAGYLVITCSSERDAEREPSYVRLLRSMRAAAVVFAGSGLDDPALNEEMDRHLAAMRADGAAVVHLSPHARRRAGGRRRQRRRDRGDGRARWSSWATGGSRSSPGRRRCTSPASGWPATGAGLEAAGHPVRRAAGRAHGVRPRRRRARRRRRCWPAARRSRRSAAPTTCSRSGRCSGWPRSASTSRARSRSPGFDDISTAALTAPEPVDGPAAAARARAGAASQHADARAGAATTPAPVGCRPTVILRDSTGAAAGDRRARPRDAAVGAPC